MDERLHATLLQAGAEHVALGRTQDELVPGRFVQPVARRQLEVGEVLEGIEVPARDRSTPVVPRLQPAELDAQPRGLELVEPRVEALDLGLAAAPPPVGAKQADVIGELGIAGGHGAAVAEGPEVLDRVEREPCRPGQTPGAVSRRAGAVSLGGVLVEEDSMAFGHLPQRLHRREAAEEVHGKDRPGPLGDGRLDRRGIHVVGDRIDVGADRCRSDQRHRHPGGDGRVGRDDDLVARADALGPQDERSASSPLATPTADAPRRRRRTRARTPRPRRPVRTRRVRARGRRRPRAPHAAPPARARGPWPVPESRIPPLLGAELLVVVEVVVAVVVLAGEHEAHGSRGEVLDLPPDHGRHMQPVVGAVQRDRLAALAIIEDHVEATGGRDQQLLEPPVGVTRPALAAGDVVQPERAPNLERDVLLRLDHGDIPAPVADCLQVDQAAARDRWFAGRRHRPIRPGVARSARGVPSPRRTRSSSRRGPR